MNHNRCAVSKPETQSPVKVVLDPASFDALANALNQPQEPGPKLKALATKTPAWQRKDR